MKSESREKDIVNVIEMVDRGFQFYIVDSSREYILELPKVKEK